jgi:hypothetical protein
MTPFDCKVCGKRIAARRHHVILDSRHVVHSDCTGTAEAHQLAAPYCTKEWHDGWDHVHAIAGARGANHLLGEEIHR